LVAVAQKNDEVVHIPDQMLPGFDFRRMSSILPIKVETQKIARQLNSVTAMPIFGISISSLLEFSPSLNQSVDYLRLFCCHGQKTKTKEVVVFSLETI
jgi:hypothetical protein